MLWRHLQQRQFAGRRFRRQHGIGPYVLDFSCPEERLAVDLDGAVHFSPARRDYDEARERDLARVGIRVVRFENRLVFEDVEGVLAAIAGAFGLPCRGASLRPQDPLFCERIAALRTPCFVSASLRSGPPVL